MKKEETQIIKIQYSDKCPICKKTIKGYSESQVKYNIDTHIKQKHNDKTGNNN